MRRISGVLQACAAPVFGVAQVLHGALNLSGPRDGLQNTRQFMPDHKKQWIIAAAAAGITKGFVPATARG